MRGLIVAALLGASPAAAEKICLQPLDPHDAWLVPIVARGVEHVFGVTAEVLPARPLPESAWYPPRKRYRADKILEDLLDDAPACTWVMGFTREDVSTSVRDRVDWGVLGLAYISGRVGVVSSFRMKRGVSKKRIAQRAVKVLNHELGHILGMDHDNRKLGCLMNDANGTVKTVDGETGLTCAHEREFFERILGRPLPARDRVDWNLVIGR